MSRVDNLISAPNFSLFSKAVSSGVSAVDASNEKRLHLPESDGNLKGSQRYGWICLVRIDRTSH